MTSDGEYYTRRYFALIKALRNWPKLPEPIALKCLSSAAKFPDDWERGKKMQSELGLKVIPPVTECEMGAGFWDRITNGEWRGTKEVFPKKTLQPDHTLGEKMKGLFKNDIR